MVQLANRVSGAAASTVLSPGEVLLSRLLHMDQLRVPTTAMQQFVAKGVVVAAGGSRITVEVTVEDGSGRPVARSTHQLLRGIPSEPASTLKSDAASHESSTPDPPFRAVPFEAVRYSATQLREEVVQRDVQLHHPMTSLLGVRVTAADEGHIVMTIPASDWFLDSSGPSIVQALPAVSLLACTWATLTAVPQHRIAVHIASRVESAAQPGSIFVTSTVREAAAGSGLCFEPRGGHRLKGVEDEWQLFAAE